MDLPLVFIVDHPLHHGVQVCQDLQVDASGFGFGGGHSNIVLGTGRLSRTLNHGFLGRAAPVPSLPGCTRALCKSAAVVSLATVAKLASRNCPQESKGEALARHKPLAGYKLQQRPWAHHGHAR